MGVRQRFYIRCIVRYIPNVETITECEVVDRKLWKTVENCGSGVRSPTLEYGQNFPRPRDRII